MMTTVFRARQRGRACRRTRPPTIAPAIRQQRVTLSDASTGLSPLRNSVAQPLYVLLAMVGGAAGDRRAATWPACCCRARRDGRARWPSASRSAPAACAWCAQMLAESALLAVGRRPGRHQVRDVGARRAARPHGQRRVVVDASISTPRSTGVCSASRWRCPALTGIGCGVLPAFRGTRVPVAEALKEQGRGSVSEGGRRGC